MELKKLFMEYVLPLLLTTALPALVALLVRALNSWVAGVVDRSNHSKASRVLERAAYFAGNVVTDIEQTLRPYIKTALADGELSKEEASYLKTIAVDRLKKIMGEQGLAELKAVLGIFDVDTFLSGLIEKAVGALTPAPAPAPQVAPANPQ